MNKLINLFYPALFILICSFAQPLFAQNNTYTIAGFVIDSVALQALDATNVMIVKEKDSIFVSGGMSDASGKFELKNIPSGRYQLVVSYLGYKTLFRPLNLSGSSRNINLGRIYIHKQDLELEEVVVAAKFNPIIVKRDTIEFNTSAYKTQESDVVEDLLKKLPGVEVESDGSVTAGGQQITKVYVEGKQFFGDDPKVAMKNLPANIIDKVQVVDRKSDQAQFTGIEDDNTEKVINLTLRPGNRNGLFGRASVGYGTDDRYNGNGMISYFQGETQLAALLSTNNTNNIGFTDFMGDAMSSTGGGGRRSGGGGGNRGGGGGGNRGGGGGNYNLGGFSISSGGGGINTTTSGGANINYRFGEKLKLGGNYFFNVVDSKMDQQSIRENILPDSVFYYTQNQSQNRNSQNHRINLELDYTINDNNSILFRPNLNIGKGESDGIYNYLTETRAGMMLNEGNTLSGSSNNSLSTSGSLLWRHKFNKAGRTLSVNLSYGVSDNQSDGTNFQDNITWNSQNNLFETDTVDQTYTNNNNGYNYGIRASYTEPFGNNRFLEFSYSYNKNNTISERRTYDFNELTNNYDLLDSAYSSKYENTYVNQQFDIRFNTRREKYSYTLGVGLQPSSLTSITWPDRDRLTQDVVNFSPSANLTYGNSRQNQLRFDYRGSTQQPTIQQLQPVADNTNPLYEREGNPDLKPSFRHNLSVTYNNFNASNLRTFLTSLSFNTTNNSIVNFTRYDGTGKQFTKPVNVNGVYNLNARIMVNMPIPNTKLSMSNTLSGNYGNSVNYSSIDSTESVKNYTKNTGLSETFRMTFRNDWLELMGTYRLGYNQARYSLENKATTNYYNHTLSGDLLINLPWSFILSSNVNYNFYRGYDDDFNRDMTMWNADISKLIFKNKRGTLKLSVYDILKQNKNYRRTTTDNYIEDTHTNTIGRFVMFSFSYRFTSFGGNINQSGRSRDGMPGGEGMPRRFEGEGGGGFRPGGGPPN
ncbi:MAG: outer membrane beta-barrel protein [Bacteroidales bacterium]|nr:outer membrane beta-barrel protein [Bacteroidales bacterium]